MMPAKKAPAPKFSSLAMFTAASVAHRINGGEYIKIGTTVLTTDSEGNQAVVPHPKTPNRYIMDQVLAGEIQPTGEDTAFTGEVVNHFRGLTFKLLSGKLLNDFEQKALQLASAEEVRQFDSAVIASLPSSYARYQKRKGIDERLAECNPGLIGTPGQKIEFTAEVVKSVFSFKWNTYYTTAITTTGHAVFFGGVERKVGSTITATGKLGGLMQPGGMNKLSHVKVKGA